jgi:organic hydroperoxide reductase OsmC/OhrA
MKFPEKLHYSITSKWDQGTGGVASTGKFNIRFDTPEEFGGLEKSPCPDHLFLSSICGCLINTFLSFKRRFNAETEDMSVESEMSISYDDKTGYRIDDIYVKFKIESSEVHLPMNRKCAELAHKFCHITRSIDSIPINLDIELIKI